MRPTPCSVAILVLMGCGTLAGQSIPVLTLDGAVTAERFGTSVVGAPDCDGDGVPDLFVGSPGASGGRGLVSVRSGATGEVIVAWSAIPTHSPPGTFFGEDLGLGATVAAGTVDGRPLLVAGAPDSFDMDFTVHERPGTVEVAHVALPFVVTGTASAQGLGTTVANVGDVNGDLHPDFLAGAPDFVAAGVRGLVRLISGRNGATLRTHTGSSTNLGRFGAALAGIGDVNDDGVPDYAIGDPDADFAGVDSGRVRLYSGANGNVLHTFDGGAAGERFGFSVAPVGRMIYGTTSAIGVAIGSPEATVLVPFPLAMLPEAGRVRVYDAGTGALAFTFSGVEAGSHFGWSVALGNTAANGSITASADLLVGAPDRTVGGFAGAGEVRGYALGNGTLVLTRPSPAPQAGGRFGYAIATGPTSTTGSVTGRDFAVGAPLQNGSGRAFEFNASGTTIGTSTGAFAMGLFGSTLTYIGDVTGDGRPELAVGIPAAFRVAILPSGVLGAIPIRTLSGNPNDGFGTQVSGVGDPTSPALNAVGLIVGAPGEDPNGLTNAGQVETTTCCEPRRRAFGFGDGPIGVSLAAVGDLDGDGATDFGVGIPRDTGGAFDAGKAEVFSGRTLALLHSFTGPLAVEGLGAAIAGLGDVDGDGVGDLAIGSPGVDLPPFALDVGRVRVFSGATGAPIRVMTGIAAGERLGSALADVGDVDGDGVRDLAAGAPFFDAPLGGADSGRVRIFSGATGAILRTIDGAIADDRFGSVLTATSDHDADGADDLLVGIPRFNAPGALAATGKAELRSTGSGAVLATIRGADAQGSDLGTAVAALDLDGDCFSELVVAAPGETSDRGRVRVVSFFGLPAGTTTFGAGCPGSGGLIPLIETHGGPPTVGNAGFGISLSCARGSTSAFLVAGFSNTFSGGAPLPFDLDVFGWSGCSLLVSADSVVPMTTFGLGAGVGTAIVPVPIPSIGTLGGFRFYSQWLVLDVGAPNGIVATTAGLEVQIQALP